MMKQLFCTLIGVFLLISASNAQSLMEDLKAISAVIDSAKTVRIQVNCKVYSKKGGELINSMNTGVTKKGNLSVSLLDDVEIFTNDKYGVYVDHERKSITVISKIKHTSRLKSIDDKSINQFVSWMKQEQKKNSFSPVLVSDKEGIRTYSVKGLDNLSEVIVVLNINTHSIVQISYEFSESSQQKQKYILLNYSKFLINSSEINLEQKNYYIQQSGTFSPGNKYKSYSISTDL